jgi:hypothetical protein
MEPMNKILLLSVSLLSGIGIAAAQDDVPKVEVPVGFSFINVHPNLPPITSFNVFGGGGQIDFNIGRYFGIKGDLMGYTQSGLNNQLKSHGYAVSASGNLFTYMAGPQIKKHSGLVQPFAEALFGGGSASKCSCEEEQESLELTKMKEWPIVLTCSLQHRSEQVDGWPYFL